MVTEDEIRDAMRLALEREHILIEGSATVALASVIRNQDPLRNKQVVVVICGANVI
ncbi:MAG: pyridoxal-phosphate dependent enzyme [Candidatus Parabeggiatoa sp.]|nr:pyridoxal-phosphate dependent enzyme [Candidatus Parabeggiatoa sp.]